MSRKSFSATLELAFGTVSSSKKVFKIPECCAHFPGITTSIPSFVPVILTESSMFDCSDGAIDEDCMEFKDELFNNVSVRITIIFFIIILQFYLLNYFKTFYSKSSRERLLLTLTRSFK